MRSEDATSTSLLNRARSDDTRAWHQIVELYTPLVRYWCQKVGLNEEDSRDVVQDVLTSVASSLRSFRKDRPGDTFRGWLRTITRNKIADYLRKNARHPQASGGTTANLLIHELSMAPQDVTEKDREENLLARSAMKLIKSEFEEKTWNAFWEATVNGRTSREIAEDLGMSAGAVRQAKYKVVRRLRIEYSGLLD